MWEGITYCISKNNKNREDSNDNEDSDSSIEGENDNRFAFVWSILEDAAAKNQGMSEVEKRSLGATVARTEHERVSANWIECKFLQSKINNKRELIFQQNETTIDTCDHLWGINMNTLMDHLIEEIGE